MKKVLIASGIAVLALAMIAGAAGYMFNTNLTVGSTGPDVSALQTWLISNNFNIPAIASGAANKGYFGSQTKAAVVAYQSSVGLPSTGFVGPLTRGRLNGSGVASNGNTGTVMCPVGFTCTANPGTGQVNNTGTTLTGITTPGIPGIIAVTAGPISSSVLNVGQTMAPVLTVRVQAQYSDLDVQSINLDLGSNTSVYNKIFNKFYVTDGGNVLASQAANSSTVVQSGSDYILGVAGFHDIVPKGTYRDIVIKADLNSSIDSNYTGSGSKVPGSNSLAGVTISGWGVGIASNGLRAVDGANINLNGPSSGIAQALTINASLVDNAQANISLDGSSPKTASLPVTDTKNNQYLGLPVMAFSVNAQNDSLYLHEVKVNFATAGTGSVTAAYLMQGSTQVASASVSSGQADFANITDGTAGASIPVNTNVVYTIKVDATGVTSASAPLQITATASSTLLTVYSSNDSTATVSGTASGNKQTISTVGPLFTLASAPTIVKEDLTAGNASVTTKKYTATFSINIQAVGTDVYIGLPASSTPGQSFGSSTTGINVAQIFVNSTASATPVTTIADYTKPSTVAVQGPDGANSFSVPRNSWVTIPVKYSFIIVNNDASKLGDNYAIQLQGINWSSSNGANGPTTFMANQTDWRTNSI